MRKGLMNFLCPPDPENTIPPGAQVHPGFGSVTLRCNGVAISEDYHAKHDIDYYTGRVKQNGGHAVWTLHINGPLSSQVYTYRDGTWTLTEKGEGFA